MVWVDAPPRRWAPRRNPIITPEQEAELRANPGRWAQVKTFSGPSSAHQARKRWKDGPGHLLLAEWEVEARKRSDGTSAVYMRFVGAAPAEILDAALVEAAELGLESRLPDPEPQPEHDWQRFSAATGRPVEEPEDAEDEDAAYEEQVGVIDGVCGPCRRLRCRLCALPGCQCSHPTHLAQARLS